MITDPFRHLRESIATEFWSIENGLILQDHKELFLKKSKKWLNNAIQIREDEPVKTGMFWADILNSEFTLSFLLKSHSMSLENMQAWNSNEKIRFIKSNFEKGYEYYGFLTHCHLFDATYLNKAAKNWFKPNEIKEQLKNSNKRKGGQIDKQWILGKCPLFQVLSKPERDFINKFRNRDSHDDTHIEKERIYSIEKGKVIDETEKVNHICSVLMSSFQVSTYFHFLLLIELDFWTLPIIILNSPQIFKYEKLNIDFGQVKKILEDEDLKTIALPSKKSLETIINFIIPLHEKIVEIVRSKIIKNHPEKLEKANDLALEKAFKIYGAILSFSLFGFWERLERSKPIVNSLLNGTKLEFKEELIEKLRNEHLADILNIIKISLMHVAKSIDNHADIEEFQALINSQGGDSIDETVIFRLINEYKANPKLSSTIFSFALIVMGYIIVTTVGGIEGQMKSLVIETL